MSDNTCSEGPLFDAPQTRAADARENLMFTLGGIGTLRGQIH
jgi:hypothetical protein